MEPGPAGSLCPLFVTLGKCPKGLQNDQETVTFIDKSANVDSFQGLKNNAKPECSKSIGLRNVSGWKT